MSKPIEDCVVLYVEDDDATAYLLQTAMRAADVRPHIVRVCDGDEAVAFLRRSGLYASAPQPDLLLLDLNLPKRDGFEVLAEIRHDSSFHEMQIYVFSTSATAEDRAAAVGTGATKIPGEGRVL